MEVDVYRATDDDLALLDHTFPLVPPDHLQRVIDEKIAGFRIVSSAGCGGSASLLGGLNPARDDPDTAYDETRSIQITYGALWRFRRLDICPTVLHEIGHVMTHGSNGLNIRSVDFERSDELGRLLVSRNNPGARSLEGLCNAYMYFLCYASEERAIHHFGAHSPASNHSGQNTAIQGDQRTRDALRQCPAFRGLDETWKNHFRER